MTSWLTDAVFYEVYPQSFQDSNADGIGDFNGIIARLDYIRDLGCNAIWINPCFDSSFYDAGYDVRDYYRTAPRYGSNEDLRRLFDEAHSRGIRVLLDLVPGHTAIDHPWFRESAKGTRNACTDRYIWSNPGTQDANSPYESIHGFLCGISERPERAAINCFATQPCLNYGFGTVTEDWQFAADSPEAEATRLLMQDIMAFWLGLGCDGFRVDMAASLVKEDPGHVWTSQLWRKVREFLDERFPEAVLVSEWGNPSEALNAGFDMDFLLHFGPSHYMDLFRERPFFAGDPQADIAAFARAYDQTYADTHGKGYICIPSGNHDMIRMRDTLSEEQMKLAFLFLLTMPCPRKAATNAPAHAPRCSGTAPPTPVSPPRPPRICICPSTRMRRAPAWPRNAMIRNRCTPPSAPSPPCAIRFPRWPPTPTSRSSMPNHTPIRWSTAGTAVTRR